MKEVEEEENIPIAGIVIPNITLNLILNDKYHKIIFIFFNV